MKDSSGTSLSDTEWILHKCWLCKTLKGGLWIASNRMWMRPWLTQPVNKMSHTSASKAVQKEVLLLNSASGLFCISSLVFPDIYSLWFLQDPSLATPVLPLSHPLNPHGTSVLDQFSCESGNTQSQEITLFPHSFKGLEVPDSSSGHLGAGGVLTLGSRTRASLDKGNSCCSETVYGELSFTALFPALRNLWEPWSKTKRNWVSVEQCQRNWDCFQSAAGSGFTLSLGMTTDSGTAYPEAEGDVNNGFSLWGVCDLLGELSWFPNQKLRDRCPLTVKIPKVAHGHPCAEMPLWMKGGGRCVRETG